MSTITKSACFFAARTAATIASKSCPAAVPGLVAVAIAVGKGSTTSSNPTTAIFHPLISNRAGFSASFSSLPAPTGAMWLRRRFSRVSTRAAGPKS